MTSQRQPGESADDGEEIGDGEHVEPGAGGGEDDFTPAGVPDGFERLWNPHRIAYMQRGQDQVSSAADCPFCEGPRREDEQALIVHRGRTCYVLLNLYPYNPGHLLICPYRHVADLTDLTAEETVEFTRLAQVAMTALRATAEPGGFNLGINQGKVGGAGISAHLHQHVVPRWGGDGNFLPIIARTKNMAQTLGETHAMIRDAWAQAEETLAASPAEDETSDDEAPDDEAPDDEAPDDEASGDEAPGDGRPR